MPETLSCNDGIQKKTQRGQETAPVGGKTSFRTESLLKKPEESMKRVLEFFEKCLKDNPSTGLTRLISDFFILVSLGSMGMLSVLIRSFRTRGTTMVIRKDHTNPVQKRRPCAHGYHLKWLF